MPDTLSDAKAVLAHSYAAFPPVKATAGASTDAPAAKPASKPAAKPTPSPTIGQELSTKKAMVDKAIQALPKMHKGGPVKVDGAYNLKAGEHVLTAPEAGKARSHAIMASGMKSLAKPAPVRAPRGTASMTIEPMPAKPKTFTDKNLEAGFGTGGANNVSTQGAKQGGSIKPEINATPKMKMPVSGVTKT
jgi:hypothetical protein